MSCLTEITSSSGLKDTRCKPFHEQIALKQQSRSPGFAVGSSSEFRSLKKKSSSLKSSCLFRCSRDTLNDIQANFKPLRSISKRSCFIARSKAGKVRFQSVVKKLTLFCYLAVFSKLDRLCCICVRTYYLIRFCTISPDIWQPRAVIHLLVDASAVVLSW